MLFTYTMLHTKYLHTKYIYLSIIIIIIYISLHTEQPMFQLRRRARTCAVPVEVRVADVLGEPHLIRRAHDEHLAPVPV